MGTDAGRFVGRVTTYVAIAIASTHIPIRTAAGTQHAARATHTMTAEAPASVAGSCGETAKSTGRAARAATTARRTAGVHREACAAAFPRDAARSADSADAANASGANTVLIVDCRIEACPETG